MSDPRKQRLSHEDFLRMFNSVEERVSRSSFEAKFERAVDDVRARVRELGDAAFCWSGGKDAQVLRAVCEAAGVFDCVLGKTAGLEYPAFLRWVTDHMPKRLEVISTPQDLEWLAAHQHMLFPQNAAIAAEWFASVQHEAQRRFFRRYRLRVLILGRRRSDGNFVGRGGANYYTDAKGVTRFSPLADWTHDDVFAAIRYLGLPLPPFYRWPRGFRCGTHPWPARQWCRDEAHGWSEIYDIDPGIVWHAATYFPGAERELARRAKSGVGH